MKNLYEILQVDNNADEKSIRKAYAKMIRRYSPEKNQEEYKEIVKAYETLSDPVHRKEYDAYLSHGSEIDEYESRMEEAFNIKNYKIAIKECKKILLIEPNLSHIKYRLAIILICDEQYESALSQLKELIDLKPNETGYYMEMANVYSKLGETSKEEASLLKAYNSNETNYYIISQIIKFYIKIKKYKKAIIFLEGCTGKNSDNLFQDFSYYLEMLKVCLASNDDQRINEVIDKIKKIVPNNKMADAAVKLSDIVADACENNSFNIAEKICVQALQFDNNNENIRELSEVINKNKIAIESYKKLIKDDRILAILKGPITYYLNINSYDGKELDEKVSESIQAIISCIRYEYSNILSSIDILKREYNELYNFRTEGFKYIYDFASEIKKFEEDSSISNKLKDLIKCWITKYNSEEEDKRYTSNAIEQISNESNENIVNGIEIIEKNYPLLYSIDSKYLQKLKANAKKGMKYTIQDEDSREQLKLLVAALIDDIFDATSSLKDVLKKIKKKIKKDLERIQEEQKLEEKKIIQEDIKLNKDDKVVAIIGAGIGMIAAGPIGMLISMIVVLFSYLFIKEMSGKASNIKSKSELVKTIKSEKTIGVGVYIAIVFTGQALGGTLGSTIGLIIGFWAHKYVVLKLKDAKKK